MTDSIRDVQLEGRHLVLKEASVGAPFRDLPKRVVLAQGGFGCTPGLRGTAVMVEFVYDGDRCRFERYDVERLATPEEVAAAEALQPKGEPFPA